MTSAPRRWMEGIIVVVLPGSGLFLRGQASVMGVAPAGSARRRLVDLVACHPIATAVAVTARMLGWSLARCLVVAAMLDQAIPFVAARNSTAPARFLCLWTLACRFRRRWPRSLATAGAALERHVSVGESGTRAIDGTAHAHHSIRRPPALARLPHRIEGSTVAWRLDVAPTDDPAELGGRLRGLSLIDPRILSAELERRDNHDDDSDAGHHDVSWVLVVDFDIEPPSWGLSVIDRGHAVVTIDPPPRQRHRHEEGDHHGNG